MDKLKDNLPILSICLLVIGTVNLMIYYNYFNIDITSYLEFSEVFQIQFRLFSTAVALVVGFVLYTAISSRFREPREHPGEKLHRENLEREEVELNPLENVVSDTAMSQTNLDSPAKKPLAKRLFYEYGIFVLIAIVSYLAHWIKTASDNTFYWLLLVSVFPFTGVVILSYLDYEEQVDKSSDDSENHSLKAYFGFCVFIVLVYMSGIHAHTSAMTLLLDKPKHDVSAIFEKDTIKTNENLRYIGKTKNYIFFYNKNQKKAQVYPTSNIKNINIIDKSGTISGK